MIHGKNIIHTIGHIMYIILYCSLIIVCFFYSQAYLKPFLYLGLVILVLGITFVIWTSLSRRKGCILAEKSISKENLVKSGPYAFVRHPEFLGHILIVSGLVLISQLWISLFVGVILIVLLYIAMLDEEKKNIEKFGAAYEDYMKKVPRINLLAGIIRQMRCKKKKVRHKW